MSFNMNMFKLGNIIGQVMNPAANTIQAQVLSTLGTASFYVAGQVVAFGTANGDTPTVRAVSTGCGVGIIAFNAKKDRYYGNAVCTVALDGTIITCAAGTVMTRGDVVGYGSTASNIPYVSTVGSGAGIGILLDNASAKDDIVRVLIKAGIAYNVTWY